MTDLQRVLDAVSIGDVLSILVALGVLVAGLKWLGPALQPLRDFTLLLQGRPGYPGVPAIPPFSERLAAVEKYASEAAFHSQPNHGTSAYDALMGEFRELRAEVLTHIETSSADRAQLHTDVDNLRAVVCEKET